MSELSQKFGEAMTGDSYSIRHFAYRSGVTIAFFITLAQKSPYPLLAQWEEIVGIEPADKSPDGSNKKYADASTHKLVWLARVFHKGKQSFESHAAFREWFEKPHPNCVGVSPKEAITTRLRDIDVVSKLIPNV